MSRFDEIYEFRLATINDIDPIMDFIRREWKADHIFAVDKEFFCYEHQRGERFNFVLVIDKETNEIAGLQGFIPYSEDENSRRYCVSGVIIKVKTPPKLPCLGVEIMRKVAELVPYKDYCAVGVNPKTCLPLVKRYMKRFVGSMQHYYRLNPDFNDYKVAQIEKRTIVEITEKQQYKLRCVSNIADTGFDFGRQFDNLPYKDRWYINKRYFNHPIYQYIIMEVVDCDGACVGLLIGREIELMQRKILRLVDFIGNTDSIQYIGQSIHTFLLDNHYEYIDFMLEGIEETAMQKAGFVLNTSDSGNIIPNYFEPFVPQNITVWFEKSKKNMALFKADGDQDRPNHR